MNISQLKIHAKLLMKNKIIILLSLLMFISTIVFAIVFMLLNADLSFMFYVLCRFIFYESFIFMVIAFLSLYLSKRNKIDETIIATKQYYYFKYIIVILLSILCIYHLLIILIFFIYAALKNDLSMLYLLLKNDYMLNVFIPELTWLIIVICLSFINDIKISSILFIIVSILFSPVCESLQWFIKPSVPIDQMINYIHKPFTMFLQNSQYSFDTLYGFQNEPYKISVFIFWVLVLFVLINRNKIIKIIMSILLIISVIGIYYPQSIYRINQKWDGTYSDYNYYDNQEMNEEEIDYKFDDYNLSIIINTDLNVKGTIHLISEQNHKDYIMTLYRKYKITKLENDMIESYKQVGDYVYLTFKQDVNEANIYIEYEGYHDMLFSNNQAVQLPGYFAWYPMAGQKNIYLNNPNIKTTHYGLNPYNRVENAYFDINVKAPYKVISNLNNFKGYSDSLTLIGGNINHNRDSLIQNYMLYKFNSNYTIEEYNQQMKTMLKDVVKQIKDVFGIDYSHILNKKIIVCSKALMRTQISGRYAEFDDYIIITDEHYLNINDIVQYHILNNKNISPAIASELLSINYKKPNQHYYTIQTWKEVIFSEYFN